MPCLPLLLLPCLPAFFQEPAAPEPLPPGIVARVGDRQITLEEYKEFLWVRFGKRAVRDLVLDQLIEDEARRYGVEVSAGELARRIDGRIEQAAATPRQGSLEDELKRNGQDMEMFRHNLEREVRRDLLLDGLVRATRVATDEILQREFETLYGPGGVKVRLRHVLLMPNVLRAEAVRAGKRPDEVDMDALHARARALAEEARRRIEAGEDFGAVAAELSHDQTTKDRGGELQAYNGRLYGPAFREAVEALEPGRLSAVVTTGAGYHVIELMERTVTRFEDVRESLTASWLASEPTWQEKTALMQGLQGGADVQMW